MIIAQEEPGCDTLRVPVLKVFDGDGFLTSLGPRRIAVRFGFTDAPEIEQPGGQEAKAFLSSLIFDRWVELVVLFKSDTGRFVDRHGRIVAVPYLSDESALGAMRNVELEMVLNGWSWVLDRYEPGEHYLDALADARRHRRGIWALEDNVHPWDFKREKYRNRPKINGNPQLNLFSDNPRGQSF